MVEQIRQKKFGDLKELDVTAASGSYLIKIGRAKSSLINEGEYHVISHDSISHKAFHVRWNDEIYVLGVDKDELESLTVAGLRNVDFELGVVFIIGESKLRINPYRDTGKIFLCVL